MNVDEYPTQADMFIFISCFWSAMMPLWLAFGGYKMSRPSQAVDRKSDTANT
jgi:hypothetical protein